MQKRLNFGPLKSQNGRQILYLSGHSQHKNLMKLGKHVLKCGLTLVDVWGAIVPPPSVNRLFSAREHQMNPRPVCKFKFCRCGPLEHSICLGLVVVARKSRVGIKNLNPKILIFFASTSKFYNKLRTSFQISSHDT